MLRHAQRRGKGNLGFGLTAAWTKPTVPRTSGTPSRARHMAPLPRRHIHHSVSNESRIGPASATFLAVIGLSSYAPLHSPPRRNVGFANSVGTRRAVDLYPHPWLTPREFCYRWTRIVPSIDRPVRNSHAGCSDPPAHHRLPRPASAKRSMLVFAKGATTASSNRGWYIRQHERRFFGVRLDGWSCGFKMRIAIAGESSTIPQPTRAPKARVALFNQSLRTRSCHFPRSSSQSPPSPPPYRSAPCRP